MSEVILLTPGRLDLEALRRIADGVGPVAIAPEAWGPIAASAELVDTVIREQRMVYGINTGFGSLARTRIAEADLAELQRRLVLSHAVGTGPLLEDRVVRLILAIKINALARGHSGVRRQVIEALMALLNAGVYPAIPAKGSVGASGDLAPLAHLSAALLGVGEMRVEGNLAPAAEGLRRAGLQPLELAAKEGLALLNGSQVSTALALVGLFAAQDIFAAALAAGALSVDAAAGSDAPFDPRIQAVRGQPGQIRVASVLRDLLSSSQIRASHQDCDRIQDPYSLRCQPQVMGAVLDHLDFAAGVLEREANAVSDNPLVFPDEGEILSGGNFHAEPVAMAADVIAIALAEIGSLSERRIALLTDSRMSELPAFLTPEPGLNSGFMILQVTAAALVSENKGLAHPASVDSLPTSANQEDHVSMATYAARRLTEMSRNAATVIAIELLAGAQGVELRRPLETSPKLLPVMRQIRARSAFLDRDRYIAPELRAMIELVLSGWFRTLAAP
ncbi:MAG TPA: histidine ammonia-lyase [Alphaproteobacteria bacterium]|nr:histidine ammonia-lyase [Alphaproteobacteria bacterium]